VTLVGIQESTVHLLEGLEEDPACLRTGSQYLVAYLRGAGERLCEYLLTYRSEAGLFEEDTLSKAPLSHGIS